MIENLDTILDFVYTLGELESSAKLDLQIQAIIDEVLAYCNRDEVPREMELPLAEVIVNELHTRETFKFNGDISSYSEGDLSISFGGGASLSNGLKYGGKLEGFKLIRGLQCLRMPKR